MASSAGSFWYLSSPYSRHKYSHALAHQEACLFLSKLAEAGVSVFCPVAHNHHAAGWIGNNRDRDFWLARNRPIAAAARGQILLCSEGWEDSEGMAEELRWFQADGKPVFYWHPEEQKRLRHLIDMLEAAL